MGIEARPLVTVFGGTGFLGRRVVSRLVEGGARVRVAARGAGGALGAGETESISADVRDDAAVAAAVRGAVAVVNAVSLYVERAGLTFDAIHVQGAARIAERARQAGVRRLVHVSGIGADADSPSSYVRARGLGERRVTGAFAAASIVRPSVLFGPGDAFLRVLDDVGRWSPVFPLFGAGDTRLQPVYVGDVAEAVARLVEPSAPREGAFELGGPRIYRYREIVRLVLAHRHRRRLLLPVPFALWRLGAAVLGALPSPPLTTDQVALVSRDNVVSAGADDFAALGIAPHALETLLAECLPR